MAPWSEFEKGWARLSAAMEGSAHFSERWSPSTNAWFQPIEPDRQMRRLYDTNAGVLMPLWSTAAPEAWTKITEAFEAVKKAHPNAMWNQAGGYWEDLVFPNPPIPGPGPQPGGPGELTPLERARLTAQADRRRELAYVETEYAAKRMDTEEYARQVKAIEDKYRNLI